MKIFVDTADLDEIRELASWWIVDGVNTNSTLVSSCGRSFKEIIDEISDIIDGPIRLEAVSEKAEDMVKEAENLVSKISEKRRKNIAIKISITPEGVKAVKILSKKGIQKNVTLIFSTNQALLAAKSDTTFVSLFIGRLDDICQEEIQIIKEIMEIFINYDI